MDIRAENHKIPELTSLRFFAAIHVVLFHNFYLAGMSSVPGVLARVINSGFSAVSFFFVLSGFLLALGFRPGQSACEFFVRRISRIYPLFLVGLFLDAPRVFHYFLETYSGIVAWAKITISLVANIFLVQAWSPRIAPTWNSPGWSLSNEAFFYAVFPILISFVFRIKSALKVVAFMALLLFFSIAPALLFSSLNAKNPFFHLPEFAMGMALARFQGLTENASHFLLVFLGKWGLVLGIVISLVGYTYLYLLPENLQLSGILAPVYMLIIYSVASGKSFYSSWLKHPYLVGLGSASYALYILHQPLKTYVAMMLVKVDLPHSIAYFVFYLATVISVSILAFLAIENPARTYLIQRLSVLSRKRQSI